MSHGHIILALSDSALSIYLVTRHGRSMMGQAQVGEAACLMLQECIAERPGACFHLLLDRADEDFHCEAIPALTGTDRREFLARKLEQSFPHTALRHSRLLRHIDKTAPQQALFSAIGATQDIDRLLGVLQQSACMLRGIYSQALTTHDLYRGMGYSPDCRLLISKNAHGLIRQSYFTVQGLRLSRVLPATDTSASSLASHTRQLHQYLLSINAIGREQTLQVHLLWDEAPAFVLDYNRALQADFLPIKVQTESQPEKRGPDLESRLMTAIARGQIRNHYGSATLRRHFLLRKLQHGLLATSALLLASAVLLGSFQHATITEQRARLTETARQIQAEIAEQHRLQTDLGRIPASARAQDIALYRTHLAHWPDVEASAQHISQVLLDCPVLLIDAFTWQAHGAPQTSVASAASSAPSWQTITLNGQLAPASDDYRRLSADLDQCLNTLASLPRSTLKAYKLPLDLRPQARIARQGQEPPDETFSLQIVLAPAAEALP